MKLQRLIFAKRSVRSSRTGSAVLVVLVVAVCMLAMLEANNTSLNVLKLEIRQIERHQAKHWQVVRGQ